MSYQGKQGKGKGLKGVEIEGGIDVSNQIVIRKGEIRGKRAVWVKFSRCIR